MVAGDTAGPLETLVNDGWNYHDTDSERLARELEAAAADAVASDLLTTFLHLSIHTIGEHLGEWGRAAQAGQACSRGPDAHRGDGEGLGQALAALGDDHGKACAIGDADAAASKLTATNLREQFAAARARVAFS